MWLIWKMFSLNHFSKQFDPHLRKQYLKQRLQLLSDKYGANISLSDQRFERRKKLPSIFRFFSSSKVDNLTFIVRTVMQVIEGRAPVYLLSFISLLQFGGKLGGGGGGGVKTKWRPLSLFFLSAQNDALHPLPPPPLKKYIKKKKKILDPPLYFVPILYIV